MRKVWTTQHRRAEADAEDFYIISLHETFDGAKKAAERGAIEDGDTDFEWRDATDTGEHLYTRPEDDDSEDDESACYLVEEWPVRS